LSLNRYLGFAVFALAVVCLSAAEARAVNYTYTYAGNSFTSIVDDPSVPAGTYTASMSVSGSFTLAAPLAPNLDANISGSVLSLNFTDGRNVLDSLGDIVAFGIKTDGSGAITEWNVVLQRVEGVNIGDQTANIETRFVPTLKKDFGRLLECTAPRSASKCFGGEDTAQVLNNPGTWSVVPEPSTALFMGLGLVGLAGVKRR
jgi:hypothetical protein